MSWLVDLYDRSHGVVDVRWADERDPWSVTLTELGWGRGAPRGSSRLLELLVGQAVHEGELLVLLEELFRLLAEVPGPPAPELAWQVQLVWGAIPRDHRPATWAFFEGVEPCTPSQEVCVRRFLG